MDVMVAGATAFAAVPLLNLPDWERRRKELDARFAGRLVLEPGGALVSVVGDGLTTSARGLPRFLGALRRAGISAAPEALLAGPLRIGACVESDQLAAAQRSLHDEFVGSPS